MRMLLDLGKSRFSESLLAEYMAEKVAYEIVDQGLAAILDIADDEDAVMADENDNRPLKDIHKVLGLDLIRPKLREAHTLGKLGKLVDPAQRIDCKWHDHTETTEKTCPRYKPTT